MSADRSFMVPPSAKKSASSKSSSSKVSTRSNPADKGEAKVEEDDIIKKPVTVTDEEFDVEAIVGHKFYEGRTYYRVKWEGYPDDKNTWEPAGNLHDARMILNDYRSSLHTNHEVEDILAHRKARKYSPGSHKVKYFVEYLVKWNNSTMEYNTWEPEETVNARGGKNMLIYYRIRQNADMGRGGWNAGKQVKAVQLLKDAGLEPEVGGTITAADMKAFLKDEDDDRDELALSAREDFGMNQTI